MNKLPLVAIVGRANVGKSSIFNRLVGKLQAIVAREPGTTRDTVWGRVVYGQQTFTLVDTAGLKNPEDKFEASIQRQIAQTADIADLLIVVIEANTMITDEDRQVARLVHKSRTPALLVINKADKVKQLDLEQYAKLGIRDWLATSASQNRGFEQLLKRITELIPKAKTTEDKPLIPIAILGRPNVGKSSLFNTIAKKQQALVAERAGTTRDVNQLNITYHKRSIQLLDTAGIRRTGRIEAGAEKFSVLRAIQAIEQSDICLVVMDAHEHSVALDKKIAGMVKDAGKGLILIVSKWDSIEKDSWTHDIMLKEISREFQFVGWAPLIFTSSITGQNVTKILDLALKIFDKRDQKIKTSELNRFLAERVAHHPPAGLKNTHPKLKYMVQTDVHPPTFTIFGSQLDFLHWSYKRYLERELRETYDFYGSPIKLIFSNKH